MNSQFCQEALFARSSFWHSSIIFSGSSSAPFAAMIKSSGLIARSGFSKFHTWMQVCLSAYARGGLMHEWESELLKIKTTIV